MVGLIDDEKHITTQWFKDEGDVIILVGLEPTRLRAAAHRDEGVATPSLGGSRYLKVCHGLKIGPPPHVDLAHEIKVQNAVRDLIREGLVKNAHDCSEVGLSVTLAESCFNPARFIGDGASHRDVSSILFNGSHCRRVCRLSYLSIVHVADRATATIDVRAEHPFGIKTRFCEGYGKSAFGAIVRVLHETFTNQIANGIL